MFWQSTIDYADVQADMNNYVAAFQLNLVNDKALRISISRNGIDFLYRETPTDDWKALFSNH